MAKCPKCGQAIEADFGMFNCPSCQSFLSVDLDGNINLAEEVEDVSTPVNNVLEPIEGLQSFEIDPPVAKVESATMQDFGEMAYSETAFEADTDNSTRVLDSANMDDVVSFGNSELSSSQTGGILYDIYLSGIDTAEIREEIRLYMGDKKFLWNVEDLMKSIKNGRLVIRRVNAVKAALFIGRIKHLDIDVQWKQNEIVRL
jgi:hypothetical protein